MSMKERKDASNVRGTEAKITNEVRTKGWKKHFKEKKIKREDKEEQSWGRPEDSKRRNNWIEAQVFKEVQSWEVPSFGGNYDSSNCYSEVHLSGKG